MMIRIHVLLFLLTIWFTDTPLHGQPADDSTSNELYSYLGWDGQLVEQPTIIKGQFTGINPDSLEFEMGKIVYNHLLNFDQELFHYEVSDDGTFEIVIPLMRPQEIMIGLPYYFGYIYAVPGKTISFTQDISKSKEIIERYGRDGWKTVAPLTFDGDLAEFNSYFNEFLPVLRKSFNWKDNSVLIDSLDQTEYKTARLIGRDAQLESLASYSGKHDLPKAIKSYFQKKIEYSAYHELMKYRFQKNLKTDRSIVLLTPSYLDFVDKSAMNIPLGMVTEEYGFWMQNLGSYTYDLIEKDYQEIHDLLDEAAVLTPDDSKYLMKLIRVQKDNSEGETESSADDFKDRIQKKYREQLRPYFIERWYAQRIKLLEDGLYPTGIGRDIVLAKIFMQEIGRQRVLSEDQLDDVDRLIENKDIKTYIRKNNEDLTTFDEDEISESIRIATRIYNQGDSLFQVMMKPHQGKVVYVDFWAPWCGPCMDEIKKSGRLKSALEGKEIVYYYICVGCKKDTWERTVKKYDISGEHYLPNEKEYTVLSERFKITGIPRYMLIDQAGKVVHDNAPRPSDVGGVVNAVSALLD